MLSWDNITLTDKDYFFGLFLFKERTLLTGGGSTLTLDLVATRTIQPGEQIFVDYYDVAHQNFINIQNWDQMSMTPFDIARNELEGADPESGDQEDDRKQKRDCSRMKTRTSRCSGKNAELSESAGKMRMNEDDDEPLQSAPTRINK